MTRWNRRLQLLWALLVAALFLGGAASQQTAQAIERDQLTRALKSTILVLTLDNDAEIIGNGSGTVMNADKGLILTNYHVLGETESGDLFNENGLVLLGIMPPDLRGAPVLKYVGQMVAGNPALDLAVVSVVALLDDLDAPLPANLGLTAIPYGNSDDLMIGDEINIYGYPGLGGQTVTFTQGVISGFLDEDNDLTYEWLKTDTEVNPGNSGGLATNAEGEFIGVPTIARSGLEVTGKLSLVRTGNIALQFYEGGSISNRPMGTGPRISKVEFGEAINRRNQVPNPAVRFPLGTTDLYASYEYENFTDGDDFTVVWYIDGFEALRDAYQWDGGAGGTGFSLVYNDDGFEEGFYEVEFLYAGERLYRGGVVVGDAQPDGPGGFSNSSREFGEITFSVDVDDSNNPIEAGASFANIDPIFASFDYAGMSNGVQWATEWFYEGQSVAGGDAVWDSGEMGRYSVSLSNGGDGLPPGAYRFELSLEGEVVRSGDFTITDRAQAPQGVRVEGVVYDRDNQRTTIEGALVVFLMPGVSVDDWVDADFPDDMVHAGGTSTADGYYQLDGTVMPGERYGVVVVHQAYNPVAEDDFLIPEDATDPYQLDVPMRRK